MADIGYIKLHRKLLNWEWTGNPNVLSIFVLCLLQANYTKKTWHGTEIPAGSFITSHEKLSMLSGLSVRQVRVTLDKLKMTGELTSKSTNRYSIISINNWGMYQTYDKPVDKQIDKPVDSPHVTQMTTTKNIKNIRRKEYNILTDFEKFYSLYPRKEAKQKAISAFKKVIEKEISIDVLINGLNRYIKHIKDTNKERKYIKQPATWLNQGCWEDEYEDVIPLSSDEEWDSTKFYKED